MSIVQYLNKLTTFCIKRQLSFRPKKKTLAIFFGDNNLGASVCNTS